MLTERERALLAAAMDRILPGGDGPGATEANAMAYVEWYVRQRSVAAHLPALRTGLSLLEDLALAHHGTSFLACGDDARDDILRRAQRVPHATVQRFFVVLIRLTLSGYLCPPVYGGNRGATGWAFIGFHPHPTTATVDAMGRLPR